MAPQSPKIRGAFTVLLVFRAGLAQIITSVEQNWKVVAALQ